MLSGQDHSQNAAGRVVLILHRHLGFAVGQQKRQGAVAAQGLEAAGQPMGELDGQGHIVFRLPAGEAKHHALIAGADLQRVRVVHAHGDVRGLVGQIHVDDGGVTVEAPPVLGIPGVPDHPAGDGFIVHPSGAGDLPHDVHVVRIGGHLTGHPGRGVLGEDGVQNGVGGLVADLVRVSSGDGFGCKASRHDSLSCRMIK